MLVASPCLSVTPPFLGVSPYRHSGAITGLCLVMLFWRWSYKRAHFGSDRILITCGNTNQKLREEPPHRVLHAHQPRLNLFDITVG